MAKRKNKVAATQIIKPAILNSPLISKIKLDYINEILDDEIARAKGMGLSISQAELERRREVYLKEHEEFLNAYAVKMIQGKSDI